MKNCNPSVSSTPKKVDGAAEPEELMKIIHMVDDEDEEVSPSLMDNTNSSEENEDETEVVEQQKGKDEDSGGEKLGGSFQDDLGAVLTRPQAHWGFTDVDSVFFVRADFEEFASCFAGWSGSRIGANKRFQVDFGLG